MKWAASFRVNGVHVILTNETAPAVITAGAVVVSREFFRSVLNDAQFTPQVDRDRECRTS
jgi:hypothetical protein